MFLSRLALPVPHHGPSEPRLARPVQADLVPVQIPEIGATRRREPPVLARLQVQRDPRRLAVVLHGPGPGAGKIRRRQAGGHRFLAAGSHHVQSYRRDRGEKNGERSPDQP